MSEADIDRVLAHDPFAQVDPSSFPDTAPLRDIIRNDTRIRSYSYGDIVVRAEDYGNSAFVVLTGAARVVLGPRLPAKALGRQEASRRGMWSAISQLWNNPGQPEVRDLGRREQVIVRGDGDDDIRVALPDPAQVTKNHRTALIGAGEMFGEIGAISRAPRTATIYADGDSELLEIRWQGLRDIRRRDRKFREQIDQLYRERSLAAQLRDTPLLSHLTPGQIAEIAPRTQFASYGSFEWYTAYKAAGERTHAERLAGEPIIAGEDEHADSLIIVRSGFARVTERVDHGHRTVGYLGPGGTFGLREIVHNWRNDQQISFQGTMRATGYVDVLRIPGDLVADHILPTMPAAALPEPVETRSGVQSAWQRGTSEGRIESAMLEFLVDNRFINGTQTMVIDVDRCTRCDECVRACAAAHGNNPRFVRHGPHYDHFMIANACMHCVDPVCLIGCPTGAIHRDTEGGTVVINDDTCIGCGTCASACPYNNIRLVNIRNRAGEFVIDQATNAPIERATKCDLCADQLGGPACQRACPNDALVRIDLRTPDKLMAWIHR